MADQDPRNQPPSGLNAPQRPMSPTTDIPSNLPIKEISNIPPQPPRPSMPQGIPSVPHQTTPPISPSPKPLISPSPMAGEGIKLPPGQIPPITPKSQSSVPMAKSSIRTMQDDLAALQKGKTPSGATVEKRPETTPIPPFAPQVKPTPTPVSPLTPKINLGAPQRSASLPTTPFPKTFSSPTPPPTPPIAKLPSAPHMPAPISPSLTPSRPSQPLSGPALKIIFIIVILFAVGAAAWYFISNREPEVAISPTPTPTETFSPTPTPIITIETIFPNIESVSIYADKNYGTNILKTISPQEPAGDPIIFNIAKPNSQTYYGLSEFLSGAGVAEPQLLASATYDKPFYGTIMKKIDNSVSHGFVISGRDVGQLTNAMISWEGAMIQGLKNLFLYDPKKAASQTFLDNSYQGIPVRYINFPNSNLTIDYAIITTTSGTPYLLITNSKIHIYTLIDRILGVSPGK